MLQSTVPYLAFQGVFSHAGLAVPGLSLFLRPLGFAARLLCHESIKHEPLMKHGVKIGLSAILLWGTKFCGIREEFQAAARIIDIASSGQRLIQAIDRLAHHISHLFTQRLYGTSLETAMRIQLSQKPSHDFDRLTQLTKEFFLALARFHLAIEGELSSFFLFHNIDDLCHQHKTQPFTHLVKYFLPGQTDIEAAVTELFQRVYHEVHPPSLEERAISTGNRLLGAFGLDSKKNEPVTIEIGPAKHAICWTGTA